MGILAYVWATRTAVSVFVAWSVENRQLLGELEGIDLLLQQLSVSNDFFHDLYKIPKRCTSFRVTIITF